MPDDPLRITSTRNDRVKDLVRLGDRRHRERQGRFVIEGVREVGRALDAGVAIDELYVCPALLRDEGRALLERARGLDGAPIPTIELAAEPFAKASRRQGADGVLAVAPTWRTDLDRLALSARPLVLVVDGLEKPGNLGALLRTAEAAGVDAVLATGGGTDVFNPNVVRASMGSLFAQPVAAADTAQLLPWLATHVGTVVATSPSAETVFWDAALHDPAGVAIVLGPEHEGLEARWLDAATQRVRVPMRSALADSLNVATTGALLLYEALRQRRG